MDIIWNLGISSSYILCYVYAGFNSTFAGKLTHTLTHMHTEDPVIWDTYYNTRIELIPVVLLCTLSNDCQDDLHSDWKLT